VIGHSNKVAGPRHSELGAMIVGLNYQLNGKAQYPVSEEVRKRLYDEMVAMLDQELTHSERMKVTKIIMMMDALNLKMTAQEMEKQKDDRVPIDVRINDLMKQRLELKPEVPHESTDHRSEGEGTP
jgi:hypothetical protein